jgi:thiol-disulfide isomerase/thioredoxin
MDKFEIYIYSYHFFSLNFSFLVARAAIIFELVLGIGLVSQCFHKLMWWGSMMMLAGYTLLLVYAQIIGRTDSCHCFGELLPFNPWQSILKNIVLMGLFALVYKVKDFSFNGKWLTLTGVAIASSVAVFAVSPPDNFISYNRDKNVNESLFAEMLSSPLLEEFHLDEGKQVIGIFSTACKYCQLSAHKISLMQQHYDFPAENMTYIFIGTEEGIKTFYEKSESAEYRSVLHDNPVSVLPIIDGKFPTIVFLDNGTIVHTYELRDMKEDEIKAFFTQP